MISPGCRLQPQLRLPPDPNYVTDTPRSEIVAKSDLDHTRSSCSRRSSERWRPHVGDRIPEIRTVQQVVELTPKLDGVTILRQRKSLLYA